MAGARCVLVPGYALIGLLALAGRPVQADQAVVVGINQYPKLQAGSNLSGPVNDAGDMAAFLTKADRCWIRERDSQVRMSVGFRC